MGALIILVPRSDNEVIDGANLVPGQGRSFSTGLQGTVLTVQSKPAGAFTTPAFPVIGRFTCRITNTR
jgi:hypothetical protein